MVWANPQNGCRKKRVTERSKKYPKGPNQSDMEKNISFLFPGQTLFSSAATEDSLRNVFQTLLHKTCEGSRGEVKPMHCFTAVQCSVSPCSWLWSREMIIWLLLSDGVLQLSVWRPGARVANIIVLAADWVKTTPGGHCQPTTMAELREQGMRSPPVGQFGNLRNF